jgi:Trk-type K+ transport system membrane component
MKLNWLFGFSISKVNCHSYWLFLKMSIDLSLECKRLSKNLSKIDDMIPRAKKFSLIVWVNMALLLLFHFLSLLIAQKEMNDAMYKT